MKPIMKHDGWLSFLFGIGGGTTFIKVKGISLLGIVHNGKELVITLLVAFGTGAAGYIGKTSVEWAVRKIKEFKNRTT